MERAMVGFHQDEEGDWVAHLSCGHTQHVRHRPPFQERPWVVEEEGRRGRIGALLECPLCDRGELPEGLEELRTTPSWDADSMPAGLRREHRLAPGVWGVLHVDAGSLRLLSPVLAGGVGVTLEAGAGQPIPPEAVHHVEPGPGCRFHLDILKVPPGGGEAACYAPLVCPGCGAVVGPAGGHKPGCPGWEEP